MKHTFERYKWQSLMAFSILYSFVYLGRFNVNNLIELIESDIRMNASQQGMIEISVYISYALGSFINGYLADRHGAKRIILTGGTLTCVLNMSVFLQTDWYGLLIICFFNGFFQSMIWVGGISMLSHWWSARERGKGIGIANFFSGMSHTVAYVIPIMMLSMWPSLGWRWTFIIPISVLLILVILFSVFAVEKPQDKGVEPYEIDVPRYVKREEMLLALKAENKTPVGHFFHKTNFIWWCMIAMISSMCRYGLLNWIPKYYETEYGGQLLSESFSTLTLPIGMAFGTLVITWIAGTKMFDNKGLVVTSMAALCGTLVVVFPMIDNTQAVLVGIFFTGFALYGINGILWVHAIDQGCRAFAGSAAGLLNSFAYLGAVMEGIIFPAAVKIFDNYLSVFLLLEVLCILMVIFGMVVSKKNTTIIPEVAE